MSSIQKASGQNKLTAAKGLPWWGIGASCLLMGALMAACNSDATGPGGTEVEIIMDSTAYGLAPLVGADVQFLIANRGSGTAYFEGCPDPVTIELERFENDQWSVVDTINACDALDIPDQVELTLDQAYEYQFMEVVDGLYRLRVFFGDDPADRGQFSVTGLEYSVN
jgi:hypothetical protein